MTEHEHLGDRLGDLADGRLTQPEADRARAHVAACVSCQRELAGIEAAKEAGARLRAADRQVPADLASSIRFAIEGDGRASQPVVSGRHTRWSRRGVLAGLAASGLAAFAIWRWRQVTGPVDSVFATLADVADGQVRMETTSRVPAEIEAYFRRVGPAVRVIDLSAMAWTLQGGVRHTVGGADSALYAYRNPAGALVVCQMYVGSLDGLPPADRVHDAGGFRFLVFSRAGSTAVFWEEGTTVCVLGSALPAPEVLALAEAKAMLPA